MTTALTANQFRQALGTALSSKLSRIFKFYKSSLELRNVDLNVQNCIYISGTSQHSPYIDIDFIFGCRYLEISNLAKKLGLTDSTFLHVSENSLNRRHIKGLPFSGDGKSSWSVNIKQPLSEKMLNEMINLIEQVIFPFFDRFNNIAAARDEFASRPVRNQQSLEKVFLFDVALDDLNHFDQWVKKLGGTYRIQADELRKSLV